MEIESLEDFVARQFEMMDRLIDASQEETVPTETVADYTPPIDPDVLRE